MFVSYIFYNLLHHFSAQDTIFYDSHDVSKADSTSSLSILDPGENITSYPPDPEKFRDIVCVLRTELGMSLLGVDVVIENWTGRYAIIDINAYPGISSHLINVCYQNICSVHLAFLNTNNPGNIVFAWCYLQHILFQYHFIFSWFGAMNI